MSSLYLKPTFESLAGVLSGREEAAGSRIVPIRTDGRRAPLFCVHPHDGQVFLYHHLARHLNAEQPVFAFQAAELMTNGRKLPRPEVLAADYVEELLAFQPGGPYFLAGYCSGAPVALEMARRLRQAGREVGLLILMDGYAPGYPRPKPGAGRTARSIFSMVDRLRRFRAFAGYVRSTNKGRRAAVLKDSVSGLAGSLLSPFGAPSNGDGEADNPLGIGGGGKSTPVLPPYRGAALLLRPSREPLGFAAGRAMGWDTVVEKLSVATIGGYFRTLIYPPRIKRLAAVLDVYLKKAQES